MTGMERNSEVVQLAAYAPLLAHVRHAGALCPTNLVVYDNHRWDGHVCCVRCGVDRPAAALPRGRPWQAPP